MRSIRLDLFQTRNLIEFYFFIIDSDDQSKCDIVTSETIEQLINEIGKLKTQMNNTELQLYEANEKIAELIESVSFQ